MLLPRNRPSMHSPAGRSVCGRTSGAPRGRTAIRHRGPAERRHRMRARALPRGSRLLHAPGASRGAAARDDRPDRRRRPLRDPHRVGPRRAVVAGRHARWATEATDTFLDEATSFTKTALVTFGGVGNALSSYAATERVEARRRGAAAEIADRLGPAETRRGPRSPRRRSSAASRPSAIPRRSSPTGALAGPLAAVGVPRPPSRARLPILPDAPPGLRAARSRGARRTASSGGRRGRGGSPSFPVIPAQAPVERPLPGPGLPQEVPWFRRNQTKLAIAPSTSSKVSNTTITREVARIS